MRSASSASKFGTGGHFEQMFSQGDKSFRAARRGIDAANEFLAWRLDSGGKHRETACASGLPFVLGCGTMNCSSVR